MPLTLPRIVLAESTSTSAPAVVAPATTSISLPVAGVGPPTQSSAKTGKNSKSWEVKQALYVPGGSVASSNGFGLVNGSTTVEPAGYHSPPSLRNATIATPRCVPVG